MNKTSTDQLNGSAKLVEREGGQGRPVLTSRRRTHLRRVYPHTKQKVGLLQKKTHLRILPAGCKRCIPEVLPD